MKYSTALVVLSLACSIGCVDSDRRETMQATPDRGRHTMATDTTPGHERDAVVVPGANEATYTSKQGDTLTSIAKANDTTLAQLIERNHLKDSNPPAPGTTFVVPKAGAR